MVLQSTTILEYFAAFGVLYILASQSIHVYTQSDICKMYDTYKIVFLIVAHL